MPRSTVEGVELRHVLGAWPDARGFDVPRPVRSAVQLVAIGVLPLIAGLTGLIRPLSGLIFAAIFALVGALRASILHFELAALRREADGHIRRERHPHLELSLIAWRSAELTSARHRTALARAVARTERNLSPARLPGTSPLNRVAARPHADLFLRLAERLRAFDRQVSPRAVLKVEDLLTSPESPLYARERAREVRASLLASIAALNNVPDPPSRNRPPLAGSQRFQAPGSANGRWL
jgi:hypothetical protein